MDRNGRIAPMAQPAEKRSLGFSPEIAAITFLVGLAWLNALGHFV